MSKWEHVEGNIATPRGFLAAAVPAGIKKVAGALDLALIFSEIPGTTAAGIFTTNAAAAAPVRLCRRHLAASRGRARAIMVNSGNANACTGLDGQRTARASAREAAQLLGLDTHHVLVASTGVIGVPLKLELILRQLPALKENLSVAGAGSVARAIMTTDTVPKCIVLRNRIGGKPVHLAGIAKGAGMIHPRMATMLSFITTDAAFAPKDLGQMLREAAGVSFNAISVDGDTSTNDTLLVLANGLSGAQVRRNASSGRQFLAGLVKLCQALARMIVKDGEGAQKLVTIDVRGARTTSDAESIARAIANSPLVKTAIAGSDPNWGRIICAAGNSGARFDPAKADIRVNGLFLCRKGVDARFDEAAAKQQLDSRELTLGLDLHQGPGRATMWTCDLTHAYIDINASYRT